MKALQSSLFMVKWTEVFKQRGTGEVKRKCDVEMDHPMYIKCRNYELYVE